MPPLRITHVISSLDVGGAETMLVRLVRASDRGRFAHRVVSLMDLGLLAAPLREADVPVVALAIHLSIASKALAAPRLMHLLRGQADVVQTWMYHSSVLGGVAAKLLRLPTIWCVRQADLDDRIPRSTRAIARLAGVMSARLPDRIVYNSALGRETHRAAGHDDSRALVIPNGFDVDMFRPDADARRTVRRELGLSTDTLLVGLIARFDPQKDHVTFVAAARRIHAAHPGARFILAGRGVDVRNKELGAMLDVAGVSAVTHCLGHTDAVPRLTAALDVACLSSRGEGFPSTVGEAMACAVPVVATAVGDVPSLVGATGYVVPPRDPPALAAAVIGLLDAPPEERTVLGAAGRARVAEKFSLAAMVGAYEDLWREVATARRPLAPARPR